MLNTAIGLYITVSAVMFYLLSYMLNTNWWGTKVLKIATGIMGMVGTAILAQLAMSIR